MNNFDDATKNIKKRTSNLTEILDHPCRILIIGGCESGQTNSLLNQINQQPHINKICLYAKDPYEAKHQFLITKEKVQA